jgi:DNA-binding transcriptional LysR family regulator
LTALRAFEAAARNRSLKMACEELHLTPGAVSQQVRELEQRLEVQLFDRTFGRYELTPLGQLLVKHLTRCFDDLEQAVAELQAHAEPRRLRLKLAPTFAVRWFAPRLVSFFSHSPGVDLEVATLSTDTEVGFEDCDFLVRVGTPPWPELDTLFLFKDELVPVCSPQLAAQLREPSDLHAQTLLHSSLREDTWTIWLRSAGLDPSWAEHGARFPNAALACEAAAGGSGIAMTQWAYVEQDLKTGRLVVPFEHHALTGNDYYMANSRYRSNEKKIANFRAWLSALVDAECNDRFKKTKPGAEHVD